MAHAISKFSAEVFIQRTLDVDSKSVFNIIIRKPTLEADSSTWRCEYEIDGPLTQHKGSLAGMDAVQALLNVLYVLSVETSMAEENLLGRLSWGGQSRHFGFPSPEADPERLDISPA